MQLTKQHIINNGILTIQKDKALACDHLFVYERFRFYYSVNGDAHSPKDLSDSDRDGIPDYIVDMLYKIVIAKKLLVESFSLRDPLSAGIFFRQGVQYIDLYLADIAVEHGIASPKIYHHTADSLAGNTCNGKSIRLTLHRNLQPKTATPIHELFHLIQYAYTPLNNLWFMEGLGRWSQSIIKKSTGKIEPLPQNAAAFRALLQKWHDAEFFWNRLTDLCDPSGTFEIPAQICDGEEVINNKRSGSAFMPVFLAKCEEQTHRLVNSQKSRNISAQANWPKEEKRSANNNKFIISALIATIEEVCATPAKELQLFLELAKPVANASSQGFETPEIQQLMLMLQKYRLGNIQVNAQAVLYSDYFDVFSSTLSIQNLDLSSGTLSNQDLACCKVVKNIIGNLTLSNNNNLTSVTGLANLESVAGHIRINQTGIENLNGINALERVKGNIELSDNKKLITINGFTRVSIVDNAVKITNNKKLTHLNGFNSLYHIKKGSLTITDCEKLQTIHGLQQLSFAKSIIIDNIGISSGFFLRRFFQANPIFPGTIKITRCKLSNVQFMHGLRQVGSSFYLHHNQLSNAQGLEQLQSIGASFSLSGNRLSDISQLAKLVNIEGMLGLAHNRLQNLNGLENLANVKITKWNREKRSLAIQGNIGLNDISALSQLQPTSQQIIIYQDQTQKITLIPQDNTKFSTNHIEIYDAKTKKPIAKYPMCHFKK